MKLLLTTLLLLSSVQAQNTLSLTLSSPSVAAGSPVTLSVNYSAGNAAAIEWTIAFPVGATAIPVVGAQSAAASKTIICNVANTTCVVFGLNNNLILAGEVAKYTVTFPSNAAGAKAFSLSNTQAATPLAGAITVVAGPAISVTVTNAYDLSGDGIIDISDINLVVNQVVGKAPCTTGDLNTDGACSIVDIQTMILKALGQ